MTESRPHIAHPWAIAIIVYWSILAVALMVGPLIGWYPVLSLAGVAPWLSAAVGLTLAAGSGLVLSALGHHRYRSTRRGHLELGTSGPDGRLVRRNHVRGVRVGPASESAVN